MDDKNDVGRTLGLVGGAALVIFGGWFLLRSFGIIPDALVTVWSRASWPVVIIVLGAILLVTSMRGGFNIRGPLPGARLYRSRGDKWIAGVLGGLGQYLGMDPVILRLGFLLLMLAGWGALVIAYIVMAVVVPLEPVGSATPPGA